MKVTFAFLDPKVASSRLRAGIPQKELARHGVGLGRDILVYGKHVLPRGIVEQYKKSVYDICDDHFHTDHEKYYREHAAFADLITVNSEEMARIVKEETWRNPVVIPDPYESEEQEAGYGKGVLWFGHQSNLKTVEPYYDIVTNILTAQDWSREAQLKAIHECGIVVIPTSDKKGKSANRLIEAVRNGRFVVAGELPAHEEFKQFMWIGDIREGISWAASHKSECISRVKDCQDYIRDRFSPETIGQMWYATIKEVFHGNNFIR